MTSLFGPSVAEMSTNPLFRGVRDHIGYLAGRALMESTFSTYTDRDGNFVKDFQSAGFSARVWELSLFAYLEESGLGLNTNFASPDYVIDGPVRLAIEAATSQPSGAVPKPTAAGGDGFPNVPQDLPEAEAEFVFQVGKALRRKLLKRFADGRAYWELDHVVGLPFVLAVEAFHDEASLFHGVSFLTSYLFGLDARAERDGEGRLIVTSVPRLEHSWKGKTIPSGLFSQPEAQHVAAVLFSNGGTAAQFNRIGAQRGLADGETAIVRMGMCANHDSNADKPLQFGYIVGDQGAPEEDFGQVLNLIHNPNAVTPLVRGSLPGVTEHWLDPATGLVTSTSPDFSPFAGITSIFSGPNAEHEAREFLNEWFASGW